MMDNTFPILLVDDDPNLLEILCVAAQQSFPEAFFLQVYSFEQAKTYLHNLERGKLKLMLVDIDLGGPHSGLALMAYIRSLPNAPFWPVIMQTVTKDTWVIEQAYLAGVSAYSVKPFQLDEWREYLFKLRAYWLDVVKLPPPR